VGRDGPAIISEATLVEQPKGKELESRIIAVNKAGEGEAGNAASVPPPTLFAGASRSKTSLQVVG